jgi:hypothetical protein
LGVAQLLDGLVALPCDARTKEQLEWVADEVLEAGGEATVWVGRPGSRADEQRIAGAMAAVVAEEYRAVVVDIADVANQSTVVRRRTLARLKRELQRIGKRDFFPPSERGHAHRAVGELADGLERLGASG